MSMRKMLTLLLCLLALASVFISCAAEQQADDLATVRLSINSERSRTINEEGNKVVKYRFEFKDKDVIQYTSEFDKGTGIYTMTGIKAGSYEINSYALNSAGNVVAEKTQNKNILRGINTISVLFDTYNSPEKGNISINVKWNAGDFKKTVDITGTINPLGEDPVGITFPATGESNNGDISTVIENLPVGSYHIKIVGKQGTKSVFGINEVVVVSPNATTVANFDFSGLIASSSITVVNNLVLPLKGELTANLTEDKNRITLNLKVTNSGIPESVYKPGGTMKKVIAEFFVEEIGAETKNTAFVPDGDTTLNCTTDPFYGPTNYSVVFYLEGVDYSMGSARIKLNYDPDNKTMTVLPITD